jgi:hypothetical protein
LNNLNSVNTLNRRLAATAGVFFAYVLWIRVYDVSTTFLMLGEQTRDWTVALGGLTELPLTGAPSTAGGRGFGPIYYWLLWIGRFSIGPFFDNLPHAGGITVALLQSIADVWLFLALAKRMHWGLALALCLLIASAPFDIALSSLIWNPPVSAAMIKMATAMALSLTPASPLRHVAAAAALAWFGVQAHLSGIFVAAPLLAALAAQRFYDRSSGSRRPLSDRLRPALAVAVTIVTLQVPFLIAAIGDSSGSAGPTSAIASITNPQVFRPWVAYSSVTGITGNLVVPMYDAFEYTVPVAIAALVVVVVYRRDLVLIATTAAAIVTATLLFTTSTRNYDGYWFVTLTTAVTLIFGMAIAAIPSKTAVKWIGFGLLTAVAWRQPARVEDSKRFFKYPQYGTMVRASRDLVARAPVVRDLTLNFDVHPTMDRFFIYRILGGQVDPRALYTATVDRDGTVTLK